jgi:hypothetical protein
MENQGVRSVRPSPFFRVSILQVTRAPPHPMRVRMPIITVNASISGPMIPAVFFIGPPGQESPDPGNYGQKKHDPSKCVHIISSHPIHNPKKKTDR